MTTPAPVRLCTVDEVFNLPLFEGYLVLDVRSEEEVAHGGSMGSSHHLRIPPGADLKQWMVGCFDYMEEELLWPAMWRYVLIYGADAVHLGDNSLAERSAHAVSSLLHEYATEAKHPRANLFATVKEVWVMESGYSHFAQKFPMLCNIGFSDMKSPPHLIAPRVFLQGRHNNAIPLHKDVLAYWGITHVITDTDVPCDADLQGVVHLVCRVKCVTSEGETHLTETMAPFGSFVCKALEDPAAQVLVKVCNRWTSGVLLASWVAKTQGVTAKEAFASIQAQLYRRIRESTVQDALEEVDEWLASDSAVYTHYSNQKLLRI